jgi:hypothetical protein
MLPLREGADMKRVTLSRTERRTLQEDSGKLAERLVEGEYANLSRFGVENFDLSGDDGPLVEVKSTQTTLANGNAGRFRLWEDQHDKLVRADRDGSAFYVFVLYDVDDGRDVEARMVRKDPATIGRSIGARGGWNESGHNQGRQYKLPVDAVF